LFVLYGIVRAIGICWYGARADRYGYEVIIRDDLDGEGLAAGEAKRYGEPWKREMRGWLWWRRSGDFEIRGEEVIEDGSGLKGEGWRKYTPSFLERRVRLSGDGAADERTALLG
jgi:hypothetical protein